MNNLNQASQPATHHRFIWMASFWFLIFLLYFGLRSHTFSSSLVHDDGLFLYAGQACAVGQIPYQDFWDHKPPGIFFYLSLPLRLFPFSLFAVKFYLILCLSFSAILLYYFCQRRFLLSTSIIVTLCYVFYTSMHFTIRSGGLTEEDALFFVVLCFWQILRRRGKLLWNSLFAGLALGIAIQFRQTYVFTVAFLIGALLHNAHQRGEKFKDVLGPFFAMMGGLVIPELIISFYFFIQGCWWDYLEGSYLFNFYYIGPARTNKPLSEVLQIQWEFIQSTGPYLYAPLLALCTCYWIPTATRWMMVPLILAFLGDLVAVSLSGEFYSHYYVQAAVSIAILHAMFIEGLAYMLKSIHQAGWLRFLSLLKLIFCIFLIVVTFVPLYWGIKQYISDYKFILRDRDAQEREFAMQRGVAKAVQQLTAPDDTILLLGQQPNSVYFLSGRHAGARYYHYSPVWKPKLRKALKDYHYGYFMDDIRTRKPVLLLVDLRVRELRELTDLEMTEDSMLDFIPGFKPYIVDNYLLLSDVLDESPSDQWFWYDIRTIILVRKDHTQAIKQRFKSLD